MRKVFGPALKISAGCAALLAAGWAAPAAAQSTTGQAKAVVLKPITLVNTRPLSFGSFFAGATAGTVTIDADTGARSATGGVIPMGGDISTASFTGYTADSRNVRVRTPKGTVVLTRIGGTETMTLTDFTLDGRKNQRVPQNEVFTFEVGGTLAVNANQADGDYEGTFVVTAEYQ